MPAEVNEPPFGKPGDVCETCKPFWLHQGMAPKRMVAVTNDDDQIMTTDVRGIPIVVCPYCDGDWILILDKKPRDNK